MQYRFKVTFPFRPLGPYLFCLPFVLFLALASGRRSEAADTRLTINLPVYGYSDVYLAGQPDGTVLAPDPSGSDSVPRNAPPRIAVKPGMVVSITASGATSNTTDEPTSTTTPDGVAGNGMVLGGAHYAISSMDGFPLSSLIGVFVGAGVPTGVPPARLTGPSFTSLNPQLRQVFFIGNGVGDAAGQGGQLLFTAPAGAKYLCLGSSDNGGTNYNNKGSFLVTVDNVNATVLPYFEPFERTPGSEWSQTTTSTTPAGGRHFLGQFGAGSGPVRLVIDPLGPHSELKVSFDLFIIRSWDGSVASANGPDIFSLHVLPGPGQPPAAPLPLTTTTFCNGGVYPEEGQAYPGTYPASYNVPQAGATEVNTLGYFANGGPCDAVYHLEFRFAHTSPSMTLDFAAILPDISMGIGNESWGLDNVSVDVPRTPVAEQNWVLYQ